MAWNHFPPFFFLPFAQWLMCQTNGRTWTLSNQCYCWAGPTVTLSLCELAFFASRVGLNTVHNVFFPKISPPIGPRDFLFSTLNNIFHDLRRASEFLLKYASIPTPATDGRVYFVDHNAMTTTWTDPRTRVLLPAVGGGVPNTVIVTVMCAKWPLFLQ